MDIAVQSFFILAREGLEAMLVITALAATLRRVDAKDRVAALYLGAVAAICASLMVAWILQNFLGGIQDERIEATIMILAAALMFFVSSWLYLNRDSGNWHSKIEVLSESVAGAPSTFALATISFLVVFREGAETVLFVHTLARASDGYSIALFAGLLAAVVVLVGFYISMQWLALKVPLRPLFVVTALALFLMGLRFVGAAVHELQEKGLSSLTPLNIPNWLNALLAGSSVESLAIQLLLFTIAIAMILVTSRSRSSLRT